MNLFEPWRNYRRFCKLSPDQRNIVFYAESKNDWHHFAPLVDQLTEKMGREVCYLTSDATDFCLKETSSRLFSFYIGEGFVRTWAFKMLEADVMVLTMMDLDNFQVKRSVNPVHYVYVFHAPGSTHMVDFENSYDHYDTIFCVGPHHVEEIRRREQLKGLPPKHLFEHGYHRLEELTELAGKVLKPTSEIPTVLVAPTWGEQSILNMCGEPLLEVLLDAGFQVILRPHYQTVKLNPELIRHYKARFGDHPDFSYVDLMGESDSIFISDLLVSDWSSIAIEYALSLEKPVLFIDVPKRVRNPRWQELAIEPMEIAIRDKVGAVLPPEQISQAPEKIRELLSQAETFKAEAARMRRKYLFNFGRSVEVAVQEIGRIADKKAGERKAKTA